MPEEFFDTFKELALIIASMTKFYTHYVFDQKAVLVNNRFCKMMILTVYIGLDSHAKSKSVN